jgi:hypothetical protein
VEVAQTEHNHAFAVAHQQHESSPNDKQIQKGERWKETKKKHVLQDAPDKENTKTNTEKELDLKMDNHYE